MIETKAGARSVVVPRIEALSPAHASAAPCGLRLARRPAGEGINLSRLVLAALVLAASASSSALLFDFNTVYLGVNNSNNSSNGLGVKVGSTQAIGTYMTGVLGSPVTVTGALATATYSGEGHVDGETLGTSDAGVHHGASTPSDVFIINNNFGLGASASDRFSMTFANYSITSLSFDWEIFPDNTCSKSTTCGHSYHPTYSNWPDIELYVNNNLTRTWQGLASLTPGKDPQGLGTTITFDFTGIGGATKLTFVDWPAEIGIDNLTITGNCVTACTTIIRNGVPEPQSLPLAALALAAMSLAVRRARTRTSFARSPGKL